MAVTNIASPYIVNECALRKQYDLRSCSRRIVDRIASVFRQAGYYIALLFHLPAYRNADFLKRKVEWKPNSQGLVVLLHGLNASPAAWHTQLGLLGKYKEVDVFAPSIHKKGLCSLDEAAQPLLPIILDYARKNQGKPLCLLGVSNGSRIATWLETKLRQEAPQTPVMVSTIAGVHFGSRQMNLLDKPALAFARRLYPEAVRSELKHGSERARDLLAQVAAPLPENCAARDYEFYATTEDSAVPDLNCSLPRIGRGERYHVVHGQGHDSIVAAVAKSQVASAIRWIQRKS